MSHDGCGGLQRTATQACMQKRRRVYQTQHHITHQNPHSFHHAAALQAHPNQAWGCLLCGWHQPSLERAHLAELDQELELHPLRFGPTPGVGQAERDRDKASLLMQARAVLCCKGFRNANRPAFCAT